MPDSDRLLDEAEVKEIRSHYERQLDGMRQRLEKAEGRGKSVEGLARELERVRKDREALDEAYAGALAEQKRLGRQCVELEIERVDFDNQIAAAHGDVERAVRVQRAAEKQADAAVEVSEAARHLADELRDENALLQAQLDDLFELEELERAAIQAKDAKRRKLGL